jgi:hypothetical protein
MKKILFAAFAATLLAAGCQKTEIIAPVSSGSAISFSTDMKKITKADDLEALATNSGFENLVAQGFNVWAYADFDISNSTNVDKTNGIFDGMENWYIEATPNEDVTTATWSARKQFYWPGKSKKLQFFAVSADSKRTVTPPTDNPKPVSYTVDIKPKFTNSSINSDDEAPMMTISGFTVSSNANEDLMVADFLTQDQESKDEAGTAGKVALNFRHTLSKVEFVFKTTSDSNTPPVYIQSLNVTKLKNAGILEVTPASTPTTPTTNIPVTTVVTPKWTEQNGEVAFGKVAEEDIPLESGKTLDYLMTEDGKSYVYQNSKGDLLSSAPTEAYVTWLMMPQTLSSASQIEVIYVIKDRQFKAIFPLIADDATTKASINKWEENKYTKYTITLSPNLISFDANVSEDWDTADNEIEHQN